MRAVTGEKASSFAAKAIRYCREHGLKVAIATAQPAGTFFHPSQRAFLGSIGIRDTDLQYCRGRDVLFDSNGSIKAPMLAELLRRSDTRPEDSLFFDDMPGNLSTAAEMGFRVARANTTGIGLTKKEFESAVTKSDGHPQLVIFDLDHTLTSPIDEFYVGPFDGEGAETNETSAPMSEFVKTVLPLLFGVAAAWFLVKALCGL